MKKYLNQVIKYLKTNSGKLILLLVTGIAIRVVVSAIFFHGDLRSTYIRAYAYLWGDLNLFSTTLDFIPHLIEMLVLFVYRFFVPDSWLLSLNGVPISFSNSFEYLNLFVYKLPYILFDIANFFIIKKLFDKDSKRAFWANIFYFLNPILIFSVYAWGRYEVIPIFFILYGFLLYKRDKIFFANIIWGLSILSRASFLLFVPVISILTGKNIREKIKNLIVSTILPILILYAQMLDLDKYSSLILQSRLVISLKQLNF